MLLKFNLRVKNPTAFLSTARRKKYGLKHNDNPVKGYNGKLEDRLKIIRGGFGSFDRAQSSMNLQ